MRISSAGFTRHTPTHTHTHTHNNNNNNNKAIPATSESSIIWCHTTPYIAKIGPRQTGALVTGHNLHEVSKAVRKTWHTKAHSQALSSDSTEERRVCVHHVLSHTCRHTHTHAHTQQTSKLPNLEANKRGHASVKFRDLPRKCLS